MFILYEDTIRRIDTLVKTGDIVYTQICGYIKTPDSIGRMNKIIKNTITNHLQALLEHGVVTVVKNLTTVQVANRAGAINETILYDLKVFNLLVIRRESSCLQMLK